MACVLCYILKKVEEENGKKVYQCQEIKRFNEAQQYYTRHCEAL